MAVFTRAVYLSVLVVLGGCDDSPVAVIDDKVTEGMNPGECDDSIDNDEDGDIDCADSDCADAPECHQGVVTTASNATALCAGGSFIQNDTYSGVVCTSPLELSTTSATNTIMTLQSGPIYATAP